MNINPQQIVMQMMQNGAGNNPAIKNMIDLAQRGDSRGVENVARNLFKSRGMDFDSIAQQAMSQFGNMFGK